jgi:hypothetical protein
VQDASGSIFPGGVSGYPTKEAIINATALRQRLELKLVISKPQSALDSAGINRGDYWHRHRGIRGNRAEFDPTLQVTRPLTPAMSKVGSELVEQCTRHDQIIGTQR